MRLATTIFALVLHTGCNQDGGLNVVRRDADSDGYDQSVDCDDAHATVNPDATEVCDGLDNDCDREIDEDAADATTFHPDADEDGYGDAETSETSCEAPEGATTDATDCDDADPTAFPGATETCDGLDDDCDGQVDEGASNGGRWYADEDGDTYGDPAVSSESCDGAEGYVADGSDCDDTDAGINPDSPEICDDIDQDCDELVDEDATDAPAWYPDADLDTYGDPAAPTEACEAPTGHVADATDCDDTDAAINPASPEICSDGDEDCDGLLNDEDPDVADPSPWYTDADEDTYGDLGAVTEACTAPDGAVADATDCDDADASISPAADEACGDGIDQDCSGRDATCRDEGPWSADGADAMVYGLESSDRFGMHFDVGDFDGDGLPDLVAGAYQDDTVDTDQGMVYLYKLPLADGEALATDDAFARVLPTTDRPYVGIQQWALGDVDEDGYEDLGIDRQKVFSGTHVLYGPLTGDHSTDEGDFALECQDGLGMSPWDDDGTGAWACACNLTRSWRTNGETTVWAADGTELASILGNSEDDQLGIDAAGGEDMDGDGIADLWVGSGVADDFGEWAGAAYLFLGPVSGDLGPDDADASLHGEEDTLFGLYLTTIDDLDGDGLPGLAASSNQEGRSGTSHGTAWVFDGDRAVGDDTGDAVATLVGSGSDGVGVYEVATGDYDGDEVVDLVAGATGNDDVATNAGLVYVAYGPVSGSIDLASEAGLEIRGVSTNDMVGWQVDMPGDLDGDGASELLFTAGYGDGGDDTNQGAIYLYYGGF